jgi:hypothetical protein
MKVYSYQSTLYLLFKRVPTVYFEYFPTFSGKYYQFFVLLQVGCANFLKTHLPFLSEVEVQRKFDNLLAIRRFFMFEITTNKKVVAPGGPTDLIVRYAYKL